MRCDVAIAGGGMGGLMAGALLARAGRHVVLAEAADRLGGYQSRLEVDGFRIEPHFHFLQDAGPGRPVHALLDRLGVRLDWLEVDPLVEFHFPDRHVAMPIDRAAFIAALKRDFPHEAPGIDRLFETTRAIREAAQRLPRLAPILVRHGTDTVGDLVGRFVSDPALKTIAGGWAAYFGYGAQAISGLAIAVFTESCFLGGVRHPVGGITTLAEALRTVIEDHGGTVLLGARVTHVTVAGGRVEGLEVDGGERITAPVVVSNIDPLTTLRELVAGHAGAASAVRRMAAIEHFRSPFSVCLAARGDALDLRGASPVHVVFPGYDTVAQDRAQLCGHAENAPVSVGIPTLMNPALAPEGHDIVLLYTFIGADRMDRLLADEPEAERLADRLVAAAGRGIPGLADAVVHRITSTAAARGIYTPATVGALGWAPTPDVLLGSRRVAGVLRHPAGAALAATAARAAPRLVARLAERSPVPGPITAVNGLFLVGQWTRTGPGMNNVFASAAAVAGAITPDV